ncbi:MAG: 30S ribosomal protein S16 [Amoebophilaceae bacterium]|jgi:small subunit ribosomal protein S16|nr:30S ribosomal protein S16 [Amoebophilaceae bacterium]
MAVKIRLTRRGRKKLALYDIVVADARAPRDGRFIEKLGNYNPNTHPATIELKEELALQWLRKGAQPTNTARTILSSHGVLLRKHLQLGVDKGAITQEAADAKLAAWQASKGEQRAKKDGQIAAKDKVEVPAKQQEAPPAVPTKAVTPAAEHVQEALTTPEVAAPSNTQDTAPVTSPEHNNDQAT